jgi:uncharacterized protein YciI
LVAQGIEMAGGRQAILGMVERMEGLPVTVAADPDAFSDPVGLGLQLGQLAQRARRALGAGDATGAGAVGVLAEQALRHRQREQGQGVGRRADLTVALAVESVALAERLLDEQAEAADTEQLDLLATAQEFLAEAETALEAGQDIRAAHLAQLARWWALKAVVLPGGITDEDARLIQEVAETLLEAAAAAVEADPTEVNLALLARATRMLEHGEENLGDGNCRGLGALWQSASISAFLTP